MLRINHSFLTAPFGPMCGPGTGGRRRAAIRECPVLRPAAESSNVVPDLFDVLRIEGRAPCEPQYGRRQSPAAGNFSGKVDDGRSPVFGMFGYLFDIDRVTVVPQNCPLSGYGSSAGEEVDQ
ncbi:MAG: hypothetical protein OJJ55_24175 [Rhodococcus sp.]|nr:hypothetical protein [Rhodococcus sp. (in: high G+C Gram-positive bacteria)]